MKFNLLHWESALFMQQMHILQVVFPLVCIYFYVLIDLLWL